MITIAMTPNNAPEPTATARAVSDRIDFSIFIFLSVARSRRYDLGRAQIQRRPELLRQRA